MGKSTWEKISTAIIITLISSGSTLLISSRTLIAGKLDRSEYKADQIEHEKKHRDEKEDLKAHFDTRFEDFKDFMIELNKR